MVGALVKFLVACVGCLVKRCQRGNDARKDDEGGVEGRASKLCPEPGSSLIMCQVLMMRIDETFICQKFKVVCVYVYVIRFQKKCFF